MDNKTIKEMLGSADPYTRRDACVEIVDGKLPEFIPDLVRFLRDGDAGVKEAALNALTSIGGRHVAGAISPLLRETDAGLRNIGIEILQIIGSEALDTLSSLLRDSDDDVVKFAVDILANIKEERAVNMLCGLIGHPNPNVRASVAVCLGRIKASGAISVLFKALNDSEEWVRFSAIEGLGLMQDSKALEPLLEIIERDSGLIKEAAIEAVSKTASCADSAQILSKIEGLLRKGQIINAGAVVELLEKAMAPGSNFKPTREFKEVYFNFFSRAMEDSERAAQENALRGLGLLKLPEGITRALDYANSLKEIDEDVESLLVDTIVAIAGHGQVPGVLKDELKKGGKSLKIIVKALGQTRTEDAVPVLEELMGRVAKHELREVVSALEAIGSSHSIEVLYQSLKSTDGHTRKIAARALSALAGEEAAGRLFEALNREVYRDVMEEITDVLALIPSDEVRNGFCGLLSSGSEAMREMGARGLGVIGDEAALRFLEKSAKDPSPKVRKVAYNSMARLGIQDSVDVIIEGLKDSDDDVKLSVLKALGGWSGEKIKAALMDALNDRNIWVRYHAVLLLGDLGENDVEKTIIDVLLKDDAPVKAAAAKALGKVGSSAAVGVLEKFIDHHDTSVRVAVENAIGALRC